jgi:hypothetical protein
MKAGVVPPGFVSIHKEIDDAFGEVVETLRTKYADMPEPDFAGQVSGLLFATAIALAKQAKCPRDTLEAFLIAIIAKEYGDAARETEPCPTCGTPVAADWLRREKQNEATRNALAAGAIVGPPPKAR